MANVRLTQLDGSLPNLALARLAYWHLSCGDTVHLTADIEPDLLEPPYDVVYASAVFSSSAALIARFRTAWPHAILGGTGTGSTTTVEDILGVGACEQASLGLWSDFRPSLGFTSRGCRMACPFCVVPSKEGSARSVNTIADLWRGPGYPRRLLLLDNDFFGQPEPAWRARIDEIRAGDFKACFAQGINARLLTPDQAAALAGIEYRDTKFQERRLYTAWDDSRHETAFFRGVDLLLDAGVLPVHIMVYMLIGYAPGETWADITHRFDALAARGLLPYPMVHDAARADPERHRKLKRFQRWATTGLYRAKPFSAYDTSRRRLALAKSHADLFAIPSLL